MTTSTMRTGSAGLDWGPVLWIGGLHVGTLLALVPGYFSWSALSVCVLLHWLIGSLGICMTYHRLLTHRSFATRPKWLEYVLTAVGCCASQGGALSWVADHRRHHAHADDEGDVHSPRRGFLWAHALWWMTPDAAARHSPEYYARWAPDLARDRVHVLLDRWYLVPPILLGAGLYAIGGMPWLVWGGFVRSVLFLHATWLVNSAAHVWGSRPFETRDTSTNVWWVALVCYGEGWHNNHHAFPTSARHGLRWWQIDLTYATIRLMSRVGLADALRLPQMARASGIPTAEPPTPRRCGDGGWDGRTTRIDATRGSLTPPGNAPAHRRWARWVRFHGTVDDWEDKTLKTETKDLEGELLTDDARPIARVQGSYRISGVGRQGPDPGYFSYSGEFELMSGGRLVEAKQQYTLKIRRFPHPLRITILDVRGPYNEGLYRADFASRTPAIEGDGPSRADFARRDEAAR